MNTTGRLPLLTVACASLAACGGGGSSSITSGAYLGPSVGIVTTQPLTPSYTGEELIAYNTLNTARASCGFGFVQQNSTLDTAALNHVTWMVQNPPNGHSETAGTNGFTGATPGDRITAAGYVWRAYAEVLTYSTATPKAGYGLSTTRALLSAPYHMAGIMFVNREIGLSLKTGGGTGSGADLTWPGGTSRVYFVADFAASSSMAPQLQAASEVLTYPCQGTDNTAYALRNESPNPILPKDLATNPIGQPVFIQVLAGRTLVIASSSITKASDTTAVLTTTLTAATDPNFELTANQAFIMPSSPLAANTQYRVTIQGTNNGTPFTKDFTFTTGS